VFTIVCALVIGKIYFLLVRIKIKHMEIALLKREVCVRARAVSLVSLLVLSSM
jgi:hypothetical protein